MDAERHGGRGGLGRAHQEAHGLRDGFGNFLGFWTWVQVEGQQQYTACDHHQMCRSAAGLGQWYALHAREHSCAASSSNRRCSAWSGTCLLQDFVI